MRLASERLEFEEAARIRDRIRELERKTGVSARPRAPKRLTTH
jgi:protein-arginine kinase activator protein McsA